MTPPVVKNEENLLCVFCFYRQDKPQIAQVIVRGLSLCITHGRVLSARVGLNDLDTIGLYERENKPPQKPQVKDIIKEL